MAGGKSSRMGKDKGLIALNGQPMIQYIINVLKSMKLDTIIISNNSNYRQFGIPVFQDIVPNKGPIGGIYTALSHSTTEKNLILSCDTPFISVSLLNDLINAAQNKNITIAEFEGREHPLIGVYDKNCRATYKSCLNRNELKLQNANKTLDVSVVSFTNHPKVEARMFSNLNTQEELKRLKL